MAGSQQVKISVSNMKNVDVIINNVELNMVEKQASWIIPMDDPYN